MAHFISSRETVGSTLAPCSGGRDAATGVVQSEPLSLELAGGVEGMAVLYPSSRMKSEQGIRARFSPATSETATARRLASAALALARPQADPAFYAQRDVITGAGAARRGG